MNALSRATIHRFVASFFLVGVLTFAGHHFAAATSTDALGSNASHHGMVPHPAQEHENPAASVEAHSPTPVIQKFQIQKQLEAVSAFSTLISLIADPSYRQAESSQIAVRSVPPSLPFDLKTTFLN